MFCSFRFPWSLGRKHHPAVWFLGAHFAKLIQWIFGAPLIKAQLAYPGKIAENMIRGGPINSNCEWCPPLALWSLSLLSVCLLYWEQSTAQLQWEEGNTKTLTCMTIRRSKTKMKEARKALETSSLGKNPRFNLSQLIQSVVMMSTTTDVRVNRTVLQGTRHLLKNIRHNNTQTVESACCLCYLY